LLALRWRRSAALLVTGVAVLVARRVKLFVTGGWGVRRFALGVGLFAVAGALRPWLFAGTDPGAVQEKSR
jgi:hypothetical protein